MKPRQHTSRGVTLIEVLVSLLLFSLSILGLVALQARATAFSLDAEDRNRATVLANELISTMWLNGSAALSDDTITAWQNKVKSPTASGLNVPEDADPSVSTDPSGVTTITIRWKAPHKTSSDRLSQYTTSVVIQ
jgi:type IV pilus assembly protein PilV